MARQSSFTAEEERIILETMNKPIRETNDALVRAGFRPRPEGTIGSKRSRLRDRGFAGALDPEGSSLVSLTEELAAVTRERELARLAAEAAERKYEATLAKLQEALAEEQKPKGKRPS